jgi:hypothetical protein
MHYTVMSDHTVTALICYDFEGQQLWRHAEWICLLSLPGNCFLVNTPEGTPLVIDGDGHVMYRSGFGGIERVVRHGQMLLFAGANEIHVTDCNLRRLLHFARPEQSRFSIDCYVDGAIYWVEESCLRRCALDGAVEDLFPLPQELIADTMDNWERATGNSALSAWYSYYWRVGFNEDRQEIFLANMLGPHLILCLDRSGQARWCTYLSCGCCGGLPAPLPNGLLVASSGCGGILSWLDRKGRVVLQSVPHEGVGLATAYTSDVLVLRGGRCLADGGPGLIAYGPRGDLEWILPKSYVHYRCDPVKEILVGCYWRTDESKSSTQACLEFCRGL